VTALEEQSLPRATETFTQTDWPLNVWYAAGWDLEFKHELLPRRICNRNLVIYRRSDGRVVALDDACWHRLLPLSQGHLEDDEVVCAYHGLVFNSQGRCVHMPSQDTINPAAYVHRYPVVERHRLAWVWMGDPALADPAKVPDLHWFEDPEWAGDGRTMDALCNYKLVVDNLMDLTHETFVHGSSIGQREVAERPFDVTHGEGRVVVSRWMLDVDPPPFWAKQLGWKTGEKPGRVDRWQIINFEAPATIAIDVGVAPVGTGAPEGDRSAGVNGMVLNTITPKTDRTCHYFYGFARNYRVGDQRITAELIQNVAGVFGEDEIIFAAQQQAIDENPDKDFYNLNIDAGAMWARRVIDQMIAAEREQEGAAVTGRT